MNQASTNTTTLLTTPFHGCHAAAGARLVDFSGWHMPVNYGSQIEEHHAVRRAAGMFDVSHMTIVDVTGPGAAPFLQRVLANDIGKITVTGGAIYGCMLNSDAGIIDDLITYKFDDKSYRLIVNAATREKDLAWLRDNQVADVDISERSELAMLAVQGPQAMQLAVPCLPQALQAPVKTLKRFCSAADEHWFVARTGYTGEDGLEIALPADAAERLWQALLAAGVQPCGLGARDTLRLEAGLNLYGTDMSETVSPLEAGIGWSVAWAPESRDFNGRTALQAQREQGTHRVMKGLILQGRGVLRSHQEVIKNGISVGEVTSGTFSPTLQQSIAMARVDAELEGQCEVLIRDKSIPAIVTGLPFVRNGRVVVEQQPSVT